ncbi:relaxase/mobilization nuclease domain-containing protein [Parapedobacter koreensis]|uniref:Relaxase/Mobilisation nuclease domain-containing protein n=1 Tax=Parapedobacter koreensis TaxID=332977 RepID=A0A1H7FGJ7_9SPHI|nr:relaxase/mobilization nuclease domain-containing protein [Parapedobacter koreensis]SEK25088.1 Relaxase/Mobilisation nuclease domain-containing protein [Parapedobacter koreensis]
MVAKIISGKDIGGVLYYNEHKVEQGEAHIILASGFAGEITDMDMLQKKQRFENLTMLNGRVKTNAIHISLNFDPTEKLTDQRMQEIAIDYMERIGFGDQPFLVYRHLDAAHPHIHIATVNIKPDGQRIDIHNIGRTLSETARKEIEEKYRLIKAEGRGQEQEQGIKPANIEAASYGQSPTKRAITNIVNAIIKEYSFTSIAELNAVLSQYNIVADRGKEGTRMHERNGLQYSLIDEKGERVGIPIKASTIYGKPTVANLEKRFDRNTEKRKQHKDGLKQRIGNVMGNHTQFTKTTFIKELAKEGIHAVFRQNEQGQLYGITYVDNINKTVFNGSDFGKAYSAKAVTDKLGKRNIPSEKEQPAKVLKPTMRQTSYLQQAAKAKNYLKMALEANRTPKQRASGDSLLPNLLSKTAPEYAPQIPKKKKKRKAIHR